MTKTKELFNNSKPKGNSKNFSGYKMFQIRLCFTFFNSLPAVQVLQVSFETAGGSVQWSLPEEVLHWVLASNQEPSVALAQDYQHQRLLQHHLMGLKSDKTYFKSLSQSDMMQNDTMVYYYHTLAVDTSNQGFQSVFM